MRLLIHVEGQTEESFVNEVLGPHLYACGYLSVGARLLGNARARMRRGGIRDWGVVMDDVRRHLLGDYGAIGATMVDYYALPVTWPGRAAAVALPMKERGLHVEQCVKGQFESDTGIVDRFEPYIVMHEFEALLFADCRGFAQAIGFEEKFEHLQSIADEFVNPEHINDSPLTAPSKRVEALIPGYQKPLFGTLAAKEIGLQRLREKCPNFGLWLGRLEAKVS